MDEKQQIIEYWKSHLSDLIPYDSPNYEEELQKTAEMLYEAIDEELNHYKIMKTDDRRFCNN